VIADDTRPISKLNLINAFIFLIYHFANVEQFFTFCLWPFGFCFVDFGCQNNA